MRSSIDSKGESVPALLARGSILFAIASAACVAEPETRADSVTSAITAGQIFEGDAVVAIARDGNRLCTGAIVAPDVVLTARHCVSRTNGLESRCDAAGNETGGSRFDGDDPP